MFTGLVETTGVLAGRSSERLRVKSAGKMENLRYGESIAVNGCCLTLERVLADGTLEFFTMAETLSRTNLGEIPPGSRVNLERALQLGSRLGGHFLSGHIDVTGKVISFRRTVDGDYELKVGIPPAFAVEVVEKGSIAIDGVSLTVIEAESDYFTVGLIPVTRQETALADRVPGSMVNLESDLLGKYVRRQLQFTANDAKTTGSKESSITLETLHEAGFL